MIALARSLAACAGVDAWTDEEAARWWRDRQSGARAADAGRRAVDAVAGANTVAVDFSGRG